MRKRACCIVARVTTQVWLRLADGSSDGSADLAVTNRLDRVDPDRVLLSNLLLSRAVVDRAAERRGDEAWQEQARRDPASRVIVACEGGLLLDSAVNARASLVSVPASEVEGLGVSADGDLTYLGLDDDGAACFAWHPNSRDDVDLTAWNDASWGELRQVGELLDPRDAGLAVTAVALDHWRRTHLHCPRCGAPTRWAAGGWSAVCPHDGSEHFPRTDPAVICLVRDRDDRALLARQGVWAQGWFSTLAGFVEAGESAEAALRREVREESGIVLASGPHDIAYLGSQPWPFPRSLMLGYHAWTDDPALSVDGEEIHEATWFTRDELARACAAGEVRLPPSISIARRLIERWYGSELPGDWSRPLSAIKR